MVLQSFNLIDYLNEVLVERCCLGCNALKFVKVNQSDDKFIQNYRDESLGIVAPVEFRGKEANIMGHSTVPVFSHKNIYYLGLVEDLNAFALLTNLVYNSLETWPLFVTALSMAVCAGVVIWLSVSGFHFTYTTLYR